MSKLQKIHIIPLMLEFTPHTLSLPNTIPLSERRQVISGIVRWSTPDWNKAEYEKVEKAINSIKTNSSGLEIEDFVTKVAETVMEIIPDRNFAVTLGSFGIEHKKKEISK